MFGKHKWCWTSVPPALDKFMALIRPLEIENGITSCLPVYHSCWEKQIIAFNQVPIGTLPIRFMFVSSYT